jgi:NAD(P)-dependent dehydrogenase (short-subunit alcohol dehydrogenase family)
MGMDTTKTMFAENCLAGRVAFVTGGASGIGLGISHTLADAGAKVVVASRKLENIEKTRDDIIAKGGQALAIQLDVRDYDSVSRAVEQTVAEFGGLDIMIANAAGNFVAPTAEMSANAWRTVIDIDLNGTFHCCRAAYSALKASEFGGRIIAISTMRAMEGWPGCAHAGAAKAGIMSLMRSLATEWGPDGIRCNTVAPGPIDGTEGVRRIYEEKGRLATEIASVPLGRMGQVSDIANAIVYLAGPGGDYITGTDLVVDGGRDRKRVVVSQNAPAVA